MTLLSRSPCWFVMSSGKMTPREEERMSSGSLETGPERRILSVSMVFCFNDDRSGGIILRFCRLTAWIFH